LSFVGKESKGILRNEPNAVVNSEAFSFALSESVKMETVRSTL